MPFEQKRFTRHYIIIAFLLITLGYTLVRYAKIAISPVKQHTGSSQISLIRGSICDSEGRLLAVDTDLYDLSMWKPSLKKGQDDALIAALVTIPGLSQVDFAKIKAEGPDFVYIARRVSGDTARAAEKVAHELGINGLRLDRVSGRVYPERELAAHLVGFVGTDNIGLAGAEASFDTILAADKTKATGPYAYGNSVWLTIDADLQYKLEKLSHAAMEANKAEALALVVVQAKTGSILAYVSLPHFDPNNFLETDKNNWTDRIAIYAYEPGSVFKVYSMGALMALGAINKNSSFVCNQKYEKNTASGDNIIIKCLGSHGTVDITKILEYSCNSGAAYASDTVSGIDFYTKIREFGFAERVGADLASESPGLIRKSQLWSARTKPTIAIGQELLVTALQMASAATIVANDGLLIRLRTLKKIVSYEGNVIEETSPNQVRRVMDSHEAKTILGAMEAVVLDTGTGYRARIDDLRMSVKTGTAQVIDPSTGRYSETNFTASTIAIFPSDNPEYIVYSAIFNPKGSSTYGGRIAAPFVKDVANTIANLYGVARSSATTLKHSGKISIKPVTEATIGDVMPNLIGLPKKALTNLLSRTDIIVEIEGEGWVKEQSPPEGEPIQNGSKIILRLE